MNKSNNLLKFTVPSYHPNQRRTSSREAVSPYMKTRESLMRASRGMKRREVVNLSIEVPDRRKAPGTSSRKRKEVTFR